MPAVFDPHYVKTYTTKLDLAEQVLADMRAFQAERGCSRLVMVWCGSTKIYLIHVGLQS